MVREVFEETGFHVASDGLVGVHSYWMSAEQRLDPTTRGNHACRVLYTAHITGGDLAVEQDGSSDDAAWVPFSQLGSIKRLDLVDQGLRLAGLSDVVDAAATPPENVAEQDVSTEPAGTGDPPRAAPGRGRARHGCPAAERLLRGGRAERGRRRGTQRGGVVHRARDREDRRGRGHPDPRARAPVPAAAQRGRCARHRGGRGIHPRGDLRRAAGRAGHHGPGLHGRPLRLRAAARSAGLAGDRREPHTGAQRIRGHRRPARAPGLPRAAAGDHGETGPSGDDVYRPCRT